MKNYLHPLTKDDPVSKLKLLAAWDGLSDEAIISILQHSIAQRYYSYNHDAINLAITNKNEYIRFLAAKLAVNAHDNALIEKVKNDTSALVRSNLIRLNEINFSMHPLEEIRNLEHTARLKVISEAPPATVKAIFTLVKEGVENPLNPVELSEIIRECMDMRTGDYTYHKDDLTEGMKLFKYKKIHSPSYKCVKGTLIDLIVGILPQKLVISEYEFEDFLEYLIRKSSLKKKKSHVLYECFLDRFTSSTELTLSQYAYLIDYDCFINPIINTKKSPFIDEISIIDLAKNRVPLLHDHDLQQEIFNLRLYYFSTYAISVLQKDNKNIGNFFSEEFEEIKSNIKEEVKNSAYTNKRQRQKATFNQEVGRANKSFFDLKNHFINSKNAWNSYLKLKKEIRTNECNYYLDGYFKELYKKCNFSIDMLDEEIKKARSNRKGSTDVIKYLQELEQKIDKKLGNIPDYKFLEKIIMWVAGSFCFIIIARWISHFFSG